MDKPVTVQSGAAGASSRDHARLRRNRYFIQIGATRRLLNFSLLPLPAGTMKCKRDSPTYPLDSTCLTQYEPRLLVDWRWWSLHVLERAESRPPAYGNKWSTCH